jgi:cobalt/nickel transport system ATP-binding protein
VRHSYEDGTSVYLCGIDFVANRGTRTVLLGPNGSGKTTLIYHVLGLLRAQEGTVRVFGVDPAVNWPAVRQHIGVVLQNVDEQLLMPTVADDVAFSPRQYGLEETDVTMRVDAALELLGISDLRDRVPHDLSGGEKRKVALAGALVMDPQLLVLDEPFEGLDPSARRGLVELIEHLAHDQGVTVVMSTHDIDSVAELADYVYALKPGGEIALRGTPAEVFAHADLVAASNIKPPILAELFAQLRERDPSVPEAALTVPQAVEALSAWKREGESA